HPRPRAAKRPSKGPGSQALGRSLSGEYLHRPGRDLGDRRAQLFPCNGCRRQHRRRDPKDREAVLTGLPSKGLIMRTTIEIENIEEMRRQEGIDDVELRGEIRGLKVGDFVK